MSYSGRKEAIPKGVERLKEAMRMIEQAGRVFALTGAGVSTLCGIPDFRTDKSGIWERFEQSKIFDIDVFRREPHLFYEFAREYIYTMKYVKPGAAHLFLAELERRGMLCGIATQNIDGLHQAAGSKVVFELHGSPRSSHCILCGRRYSQEDTEERLKDVPYPACDCGGPIKPDVIFYGELLPEKTLRGAIEEATSCALLLVLGTSLVVYPAASIPQIALSSGARALIFNKTPTQFDDEAAIVIREDLKDVCEFLLDHLYSKNGR